MFDTRMPSPIVPHVSTACVGVHTLLCTLGHIERLSLFSVVLTARPALEAEHRDADDEAQQDQDEDDAAGDGASRVHCRAEGETDQLA